MLLIQVRVTCCGLMQKGLVKQHQRASEVRNVGTAGQDGVRGGEVGLTFVRENRVQIFHNYMCGRHILIQEAAIYDQ